MVAPGRVSSGRFRPFGSVSRSSGPSTPSPLPAHRTGRADVGIEIGRAHGRVRWLVRCFRVGPQSGSHGHVSQSPPTIPDGRISRVRFWPRLCTPFIRTSLPPWRDATVRAHLSPRHHGVCFTPSPRNPGRRISSSASGCASVTVATECPEPLCPAGALSPSGQPRKPPGRALPLRRRSYGLMRQTIVLPVPPVVPLYPGSLQVAARPCWAMALPDIISATLV